MKDIYDDDDDEEEEEPELNNVSVKLFWTIDLLLYFLVV